MAVCPKVRREDESMRARAGRSCGAHSLALVTRLVRFHDVGVEVSVQQTFAAVRQDKAVASFFGSWGIDLVRCGMK